jgi:hypothetical protein
LQRVVVRHYGILLSRIKSFIDRLASMQPASQIVQNRNSPVTALSNSRHRHIRFFRSADAQIL